MDREKQLRVLETIGRYKVVDGRLWHCYQGRWKEKVASVTGGYRQHILNNGRGWGKVVAYEHCIVWLYANGVYDGEIDHINNDRLDNRIENLEPVSKRENMLRCHQIPSHVVRWTTFDRVSVMTVVELYLLGFGFTGIARETGKDRSSVVYQVRNILFGKKKSWFLSPDEVLSYRRMYNKEIEFQSMLDFPNRYVV